MFVGSTSMSCSYMCKALSNLKKLIFSQTAVKSDRQTKIGNKEFTFDNKQQTTKFRPYAKLIPQQSFHANGYKRYLCSASIRNAWSLRTRLLRGNFSCKALIDSTAKSCLAQSNAAIQTCNKLQWQKLWNHRMVLFLRKTCNKVDRLATVSWKVPSS